MNPIVEMKPVIVWFRQDLRLRDNPALAHAAKSGRPLICLFILDDVTPGIWKWGGASRWWLHHSLEQLGRALSKYRGGTLILRRGRADTIIKSVIDETGADHIVWNRSYDPFAMTRDTALAEDLAKSGVSKKSFNAALLVEPWQLQSKTGSPYRVFTPFWHALRADKPPEPPLPPPDVMRFQPGVNSETLGDWTLRPSRPNWAKGFEKIWTPGEAGAHKVLQAFLGSITRYKTGRDHPAQDDTSFLSPHLHWGEISPRQIWHAVRSHADGDCDGAETFLKELGWREFCHQLLFHNPDLPQAPFDKRFAKFSWVENKPAFDAWCRGQTGIPMVDAGMRQLWQTGWMHNRVRMIVASFLIKHLGIDWRRGQDWFWDTLVDADLANNAANWQWVAGSGADAAPFFRIFNPVLQGEKFDPGGKYVRAFVPELKQVPDRFVHRPWEAPQPPSDYSAPLVDLAQGRARALDAFKALKG